MRLHNYIILFCLSLILTNCGENNTEQQTGLAININTKSLLLGDTLNLTITNPKDLSISEVRFALDGNPIIQNEVLNEVSVVNENFTDVVKFIIQFDLGTNHQRPVNQGAD